MGQYLYSIAGDIPNASADLLGGKGYGLWKMRHAGIPVPLAYIITTEACRDYMKEPAQVMDTVRKIIIPQILEGLKAEFGFSPLVSVRSGAKFSMPGMMDTILNVGLDDESLPQWAIRLGDACALDSYERLIEMYGSVVKGIERKKFETLDAIERRAFYMQAVVEDFPNAADQLLGAIEAVFKSWNNERAKTYRKLNKIPDDLGTAVTVQAMVFGNMNDKSCTGVLFTRNPSNGENEIIGEFLVNAQGEDVVAGIRTPDPLSKMQVWNATAAAELEKTVSGLEQVNRDMQDVEFTVQDGKLYILQTRNGQRTAQAAVKIALDLVTEGLITVEDAVARVTLKQFLAATRPIIDAKWKAKNPANAKGISASNGCCTGVAVFSSKNAINCKEPCILLAEETTPDDIGGMNASVGILTSTGGLTSHAAVVARGMDKVCVVGCTDLVYKKADKKWVLKGKTIKENDSKITIDGSTGEVWVGQDVPVAGGVGNALVSKFVNILEEKYGIYRTVTCPADMGDAGRLLVSTYMLDRVLDQELLETGMRELLESIQDRDAIIDMRPIQDVVRDGDERMEFIWGHLNTPSEAVKRKVKVLLDSKKILPKAKVLEAGLTADQVNKLTSKGFEIIPAVSKLKQLQSIKGLCQPDFERLIAESGKGKIQEVVAEKKAKGEPVKSFNIVEEIEPDVALRGMSFAMSSMQTAQSMLKKS